MLGYTELNWQSVQAPLAPPRPSLDPLVGGYRRIPVAQIGADIFCDTSIIAEEISLLSGQKELSPFELNEEDQSYYSYLENQAFYAAIGSIPVFGLIKALLKQIPLGKIPGYLKDKKHLFEGSTVTKPSRTKAKQEWQTHLSTLNVRLQDNFLHGNSPGILDFAAYPMIWFRLKMDGPQMIAPFPQLENWVGRMQKIGHGKYEEIEDSQAIDAARVSIPVTRGQSATDIPLLGQTVRITPQDYGLISTDGILTAEEPNRWIIAKETKAASRIQIHFPKNGYAIEPISS